LTFEPWAISSEAALDRAPRDADPLAVELHPDLPRAVHLVVLLPHPSDLDEQLGVTPRTS
jgi:hypothetical protein